MQKLFTAGTRDANVGGDVGDFCIPPGAVLPHNSPSGFPVERPAQGRIAFLHGGVFVVVNCLAMADHFERVAEIYCPCKDPQSYVHGRQNVPHSPASVTNRLFGKSRRALASSRLEPGHLKNR